MGDGKRVVGMMGINLSVGGVPASQWNVGAIRLAVPDAQPGRWGCGPYLAALGGAATHGGYRGAALPALLGARLSMPVANFGCRHAGPDAFLHDRGLCAAVARAELCVIEATGVRTVTNSLFRVHPRRNDRVLAAEPALKRLYPEVDFAEIAFIGHLMDVLRRGGPERFGQVVVTLRARWQAAMLELLAQWRCPTVLWWQDAGGRTDEGEGLDPDADLIAPLAARCAATIAIPATTGGAPASPARVAAELAKAVAKLVPKARRG